MIKRAALVLWILFTLLLAYSVASFPLGLERPPFLTPLTTVVGFTLGLSHGAGRMGWRSTLILLACVFIISLAFESTGVATGWVYGPYHYTDRLGPLFLGLVPYLIPMAWFMMAYPSFVLAQRLAGEGMGWKRPLAVAAIGGVIMTAWDVVMDPVMVQGGHWVWDVSGSYFGVPLQNYWGWWLTVFTTFLVFQLLTGRTTGAGADPGFDRIALATYAAMGLNSVSVALLTGLGGPALGGIFAMAPWVIAGWNKLGQGDASAAEIRT